MKTIIETEIGELFWEDEQNGIVCGRTKPDVEITIDKLKVDFFTYEKYFPHDNKKLLLDMSELSGANKEVRDFFAGPEGVYNYFEAVAVLTSSKYSIAGIIAYVSLKIYALRKPTELFHDRMKAVNWLRKVHHPTGLFA